MLLIYLSLLYSLVPRRLLIYLVRNVAGGFWELRGWTRILRSTIICAEIIITIFVLHNLVLLLRLCHWAIRRRGVSNFPILYRINWSGRLCCVRLDQRVMHLR